MGLKDVAALVTNDPKTQNNIVMLLTVIEKKEVTLEHILAVTEFKDRYLRFLITKLRSIRLLMGEKRHNRYFYYISYDSFTTYLKTKYSDAIYNLVRRN